MRWAKVRVLSFMCLLTVSGASCGSPAFGCGLTDWLFGRAPTPQPVVVGYTPACPPVDPCDPCNPCNVSSPVVAYQAPRSGCLWPFGRRAATPAPPPAAPITPQVNPTPQTYFRTSWKRIPVTVYRPTTTTDPVTGCPVTVMKPCTTYQWQAQRQPLGLLGRLFNPAPRPAVANTMAVAPGYGGWPIASTTTAPMTTVTPDCCGSAVVTMPPAATPSAAAPYLSAPPAGSSAPPPSMTAPPSGAPLPGTATPPSGSAPADQRPSLSPDEVPPATQLEPNNSASYRATPSTEMGPSLGPALPSTTGQQTPPSPRGGSGLQPVPDPDAEPAQPDSPAAPKLLNPRDRVAHHAVGQAWACVPISWNSTEKAAVQPIRSKPAAAPATDSARLNDRGWRTVRP